MRPYIDWSTYERDPNSTVSFGVLESRIGPGPSIRIEVGQKKRGRRDHTLRLQDHHDDTEFSTRFSDRPVRTEGDDVRDEVVEGAPLPTPLNLVWEFVGKLERKLILSQPVYRPL